MYVDIRRLHRCGQGVGLLQFRQPSVNQIFLHACRYFVFLGRPLNSMTDRMSAERQSSAARGEDYPRLRVRLYLLLMGADTVLIGTSFIVANLLRVGRPFESYGINTFLVLWPIYLGIALNGRAFSLDALKDVRASVMSAIQALIFALVIATALFFSLKIGEDFSRLVFGIGAVVAPLFLVAGRISLGRAFGRRCHGVFRREILLADGVFAVPAEGEELVNAEHEGIRPVTDDPAMLDRLGQLLDRCERVILACPLERREAWVRMLAGANVDVEIEVPELERLGALELRRDGDRRTLLIGRGPLRLRQRAAKRVLDIVISGSALLILSPLLLAIAIVVKLDSTGPALFRQTRMGRGNRLFEMLKFRTMRTDAGDADGTRSAAPDDDRITRIGGFLRRTSLDELPQLINVLRGQMSIVGPRPHALGSTAEDKSFWAIEERYWDRHGIKPGMTGEAQIRGFRGATQTRADLTNRLQADLEYLDGWTIGRDLGIIVRTVKVLTHRNAY